MTWPQEYQQAAPDFERFMVAARDAAGLPTTNAAWNMVQGVFFAFRRRLNARQTMCFAAVLPPLARVMFLEGWEPAEPPLAFAPRASITAEVKALRAQHNFSPDNAVDCVAAAVRQSVQEEALERVLDQLPPEARQFWGWPKAAG